MSLGGVVREASQGQVAAVLANANAGDTIVCTGGAQSKLVLTRSFAAPGVVVRCGAGSYFQGVDTNGQSGYTFDGIESRLPVEVNDYNVTPFYLHGASARITITGAFRFTGGYDAIKVYGGCRDCVIDDGGAASDLSNYGGDGIHVNGATNLRIVSVAIDSPSTLPSPEHNDGIHAQAFSNLYIGPGVRITALGTRSDVDSAGIFIQKADAAANGLLIEGTRIRWQIGRGMQMMFIDGSCVLRNVEITDSGILGASPPLTLDASQGQRIDLYGINRSDVYFNSSTGESATTFH